MTKANKSNSSRRQGTTRANDAVVNPEGSNGTMFGSGGTGGTGGTGKHRNLLRLGIPMIALAAVATTSVLIAYGNGTNEDTIIAADDEKTTVNSVSAIPATTLATSSIIAIDSTNEENDLPDGDAQFSPAALEAILLRAGINAETLTAAGISSTDVSTIVTQATDHLTTNLLELTQADQSILNAKPSINQFKRLITKGRGNQDDLSAYADAQSSLQTAQNACNQALEDTVTAAFDNMNTANTNLLLTIAGNATSVGGYAKVDVAFLTVDRSESDWLALSEALEQERQATEWNETLNAEAADLLASARNNVIVSAANSSLAINLAANTTAWTNTVEQQGQ